MTYFPTRSQYIPEAAQGLTNPTEHYDPLYNASDRRFLG